MNDPYEDSAGDVGRLIDAIDLQACRFVVHEDADACDHHRLRKGERVDAVAVKFESAVFVEDFFLWSFGCQIGQLDIVDSQIRCLAAGSFEKYLSDGPAERGVAEGFKPGAVARRGSSQQDFSRIVTLCDGRSYGPDIIGNTVNRQAC